MAASDSASKQTVRMVLFSGLSLCLLGGLTMPSSVFGQAAKPAVITLEGPQAKFKDPKEAAALERALGSVKLARDMSKVDAETIAATNFYLQTYIPWKLTQQEFQPEYSAIVDDLLKTLESVQRSGGPGYRTIIRGLFIGMQKVAKGNFSPASRINAINALARMDAKPVDKINKRPPLPLSYSFQTLLPIYQDTKNSDGVRAAALHGIHRYVHYAFPVMKANEKQAVADEMKKLLSTPAPAGRAELAHAYLQRFAVDSLDSLRAANDASLGTQLVSISTDEAKPDLIALYSASKLGNFKTEIAGKVDNGPEVLTKWSARAYKAIESELARIAALERPDSAGVAQPASPKTFLEAKKTKRATRSPAGMSSMEGRGMSEMSMDMDMSMDGMRMSEMDMSMDMEGMDMMGMYGMGSMVPQAKPQPPNVLISRRHLTNVLEQLLRGASGSRIGDTSDNAAGLIVAVADPQKEQVQTWIDQIKAILEAINDPALDDQDKWVEALETHRLPLAELAGIEIEQADGADEDEGINNMPLLPGFGPAPAEEEAAAPALPGFG